MKTVLGGIAAAVVWSLGAAQGAAAAEAKYPTRPVRMIVPFAPGGPTDVIARVVAQKLSEAFHEQVVVDNRAGAGGNIGMGLAANSPADGHTIIMVSSSYVVNPGLYAQVPYDPFKSFIPVSNVAASPNVFTVHPSIPAKTMQELAKLAAEGKKLNVGTPGVGTTPDLSAELFKMTAKIDLVRVPFAGAGPAVTAVIGNQVNVGCTALPPTTPHIQGGRLRALAVTGAKRTPTLPDVPTMAESGYNGQEADTLQGLLVPAGTPRPIVMRLHEEIRKMMQQKDVQERVAGLGFDVVASTPEQFAAQVKVEVDKWGKVIKAAGIKAD